MPASPAPFSQRARPAPGLGKRARRAWGLALGLGIGLVPLQVGAKPAAAADPGFAALLRSADLMALDAACAAALEQGNKTRLRQLQQRLLTLYPAPQPVGLVLANADGLLRCGAPEGALQVLERVGPAAGADRRQWLLLQWRAAQAGLNHQRAAEALERLADGDPARLASIELPLSQRRDGALVTRPALDLLAGHLESLGQRQRAAEVLLAGAQSGPAAAARLVQALLLSDDLPAFERERLQELALEQAAAAGSWGLVAEMLDQQLTLAGRAPQAAARAEERRLRLSRGIDDAYGEWLLRRRDPSALTRQGELERQLRSPRAPGGHAASPTPVSPP